MKATLVALLICLAFIQINSEALPKPGPAPEPKPIAAVLSKLGIVGKLLGNKPSTPAADPAATTTDPAATTTAPV